MPILKCNNPEGKGTWLKDTSAIQPNQDVLQSKYIADSKLIWVKNGQSIAYSKHIDLPGSNAVLHLNLGGFRKLVAYTPHFPGMRSVEKTNLEHDWVFFPQTDNEYLSSRYSPDNTCNSSSCAMYLEFFRPEMIQDDMDYIRKMFDAGFQSTNHDHQNIMLKRFGVESVFRYNAHWDDLIQETNRGYPTTVGFYHRGPIGKPRGGHVGTLIDANEDWVEMLDPYGSLLDGYTTSVLNGYRVIYPRRIFGPRWIGNGNGFMREFIGFTTPTIAV